MSDYLPNDLALRGMLLNEGGWSYTVQAMAREILRLRELIGDTASTQVPSELKTEPPADVLGEAFRSFMNRAATSNGKPFETVIFYAVEELAAAFERHVRGGGK